MPHHCDALLIQCMDFRFMKGIRSFLDEQGLTGTCDHVSIAGGAKNFVNPAAPAYAEVAMCQVELSNALHAVKRVILINHLDCGAYGGASAFASLEEERARHLADLDAAREKVLGKFPSLQVDLALASLGEDGEARVELLVIATSNA